MTLHVLVLEDDDDIASLLTMHLKVMGHSVSRVSSMFEGHKALETQQVDAIILDRGLNDGDGARFCAEIRQNKNGLPVMMLTARDSEHDIIDGLESGADDYLTKPFSVVQFQARMRALLRRMTYDTWQSNEPKDGSSEKNSSESDVLVFDDLVINPITFSVCRGEVSISLTATEFSLLHLMARNPEHVFSKDALLDKVWQTQFEGYHHAVCCTVNRLRSKLEVTPDKPKFIQTVWGVGYKFSA
ncbi:DNA-binding response regulator [Veronia nyctiphanis]|uniref:Phosphate regulon transcriptional regulatory protein PhoB n=1 Tax=Veronia nyctiphanis TaxID=1278244 RepID=A0A4Q0YUR3_9GAMM|nr:response regulator transcription factor [Veronia nyctiphanis]RXJ74555.1 DNA-binding response regulator [Veronia nyctiphanis]